MKLLLSVTMALLVAGAQTASAGTDDARRPSREDAPRMLKEAVRTGTADAAAFAAIADWILYEKEEKVAAGLADVLGALEPTMTGADGERWNDTTRAMFSLFGAVLRDAANNRRRSGDDLDVEIAALVKAATPAVAAALRETGVTIDACEALKKIEAE